MSERKGDWMQTRYGRQYWPLDPSPDDVAVDDIASHLSKICRYNGACTVFYSVAEHSVHVSRLVPDELALPALFHDAAEAYCQDIVRPVKRHLAEYAAIEQANEVAIIVGLNLPIIGRTHRETIKDADDAMLLAEQREIMLPPPADWAALDVPDEILAEAHRLVTRRRQRLVLPDTAEQMFLDRYAELRSQ